MADITQINLIGLVPDSIRGDPQVQAAAAAIDNELKAVTAAIPATLLIARLDELPEAVIDLLAWQWHVDYYEPVGMDIDTKRVLIRQSIDWHRHKGTPGVVQEVVTAVLGDAKVLEWFEYVGEPYWFKVECNDVINDGRTYEHLMRLVSAVKNTRSWLEKVTIYKEYKGSLSIGTIPVIGTKILIKPVLKYQPRIDTTLTIGNVLHQATKLIIGPNRFTLQVAPTALHCGALVATGTKTRLLPRQPNISIASSRITAGFVICRGQKLTIRPQGGI